MGSSHLLPSILLPALLLAVYSPHSASAQGDSFPFRTPATCQAGGRAFDLSALSCVACNSSVLPSGLGCECRVDQRIVEADRDVGLGVSISCQPCPTDQAPDRDQHGCLACTDATVALALDGSCACVNPLHVLVEAGGGFRCEQCPSGSTVDPLDRFACVRCPTAAMSNSSSESCACPSGHTKLDDQCIASASVYTPRSFQFSFPDSGVVVTSQLLSDLLVPAVSYCQQLPRNQTACQILANLCVLHLYEVDAEACARYRELVAVGGGFVNGVEDWPENLPWLYYSEDFEPGSVVPGLSVTLGDSSGNATVAELRFILAKYSVDGRFLAHEDLTSQLQLCLARYTTMRAFLRFATDYENACSLDLASSAEIDLQEGLVFYDMYLQDADGGLLPVPAEVNGRFVRRFFTMDNQTGVAAACTGSPDCLEAVRFATSVKLAFRLIADGQISIPVLSLGYSDVAHPFGAQSLGFAFSTEYSQSLTSYRNGLIAAIAICAALSVLLYFVRISSWRRRNRYEYLNFETLIVSLVELGGAFSTFLFWILFGTAMYWLIFFKGQQSTVQVVLSDDDVDDLFVPMLVTALVFKLLEVAHLVYSQVTADIFLVDWEKNRHDGHPVSIWRTYFVANEWNEIQTLRQIHVGFHVLAMLFFLFVADAKELATTDPDELQDYQGNTHHFLRLAVVMLLSVSLGFGQYVYRTYIHRRFVEDKLGQFVDLCSLANISVFVLQERYFGYYLHGKSVHGFSDTNMWEMKRQLRKEEENLTSQRGLLPNSDHQTFEIHVPPKLRTDWDSVYLNVLAQHDDLDGRAGADKGLGVSDKSIHAYQTINSFLCAFIQHSFRDLDYVVQEQPFVSGCLGLTPEVGQRGVFYADDNNSFSNVLFHGHPVTLFMFDTLVFGFFDYATQSFVAGAVLAYVISALLDVVRDSKGRSNLATKTLVDKRFLI